MATDKSLGMVAAISRREFVQGIAVAAGAGLGGCAAAAPAAGSPEIGNGYYPPALIGLRGAHAGSFETAHALVHEGRRWDSGRPTGEATFDLVVIGAGLSGLAAAWFYRRERPDARILILDNHDDFGGHAKRNEFDVDGRTLIGYGGSQSIDTPSSYSAPSRELLRALAVDLDVFRDAFDRSVYERHGLTTAYFLDRDAFGVERLVRGNYLAGWGRSESPGGAERFAEGITTNASDRERLIELLSGRVDYLAGRTPQQKFAYLRAISYDDYLRRHAGLSPSFIRVTNPLAKGIWGVGCDAISAREAMYLSMAGFDGLGLDLRSDPYPVADADDPYIFHFPDGNAAIARLIVRQLVPGCAPGETMHDVVDARFDYAALDSRDNDVRIRLNATVVHAANSSGPGSAPRVELRYVKDGRAWDVAARDVIYAGYSAMLPHIFPEFPAAQQAAFADLVRAPLLYANVVVRSWQPFVDAGVERVYFPGGLFDSVSLDFPVSLGNYRFPAEPTEPAILHFSYVPTEPGRGLDNRAQMRAGRARMLGLSFADYERSLRSQLAGALAGTRFDPAVDIRAITVNRWPHGYAYEYNDLYDDPAWNRHTGPHVSARRPFGRVSIAGSDAEAYAYVNGAVDSAWRAVRERLAAPRRNVVSRR